MKQKILQAVFVVLLGAGANAQVNSGSNGSDGAFNPATNTVINMADHPDGIYQYASVNISNGVTVTFIPNANNSPVVWLVQSNCVINGTVKLPGDFAAGDLEHQSAPGGGAGGPGGYHGGNNGTTAGNGQGPGGGNSGNMAGNGSFGGLGGQWSNQLPPGQTYGSIYLLPLIGGSGGGGSSNASVQGGGGGGGAIMIAASDSITLNGTIAAIGGSIRGFGEFGMPGAGSGGAVRLVTTRMTGSGSISVDGGRVWDYPSGTYSNGGLGRIRLDVFENSFSGIINGVFTQGFQPIIIPVAGQGVQLSIASVAGASVSSTPNGQVASPDAIISGQQANPIPVVVHCANLPLSTLITVTVKPASGASVSAVGYNTTGTLASSTATVSLNMPRGGGLIYATAVTGN